MATRYPEFGRLITIMKSNPQFWLAAGVLVTGCFSLEDAPALAGAGINEWNSQRSTAAERKRRHDEALRFFAPELNRSILRVIHTMERANANYNVAWSKAELKTGDKKQDLLPTFPVLFPRASQLDHLFGDETIALVTFYDSLNPIRDIVEDWWQREDLPPENIFNGIMYCCETSLQLAVACIEKFDLETLCPPRNKSLLPISIRVQSVLPMAQNSRANAIKKNDH